MVEEVGEAGGAGGEAGAAIEVLLAAGHLPAHPQVVLQRVGLPEVGAGDAAGW